MGQCFRPDHLETMLITGMVDIIGLHQLNAPGKHPTGLFRDAGDDMQVGLGLLGLSNFLALNGFAYARWAMALHYLVEVAHRGIHKLVNFPEFPADFQRWIQAEQADGRLEHLVELRAQNARMWPFLMKFIDGYIKAARIAKQLGYQRAFCIAPTASSSFRHKDFKGNTCVPNIMPPVSRKVERISQTVKDDAGEVYNYGNVEVAKEVSFRMYALNVEAMQMLFNATGLAHSVSFDILEDVDEDWLEWWNGSAIRATYYRTSIEVDYLDKSDVARLNAPKGGELQCACGG